MNDNYIGETLGVFEIIAYARYKDKDRHTLYEGICKECGFKRIARISDFKESKKCTHIRIDGKVAFYRTNWNNKRIMRIFDGMKRRCYDETSKSYRWYGAKGIKICDEWMDDPKLFEEWAISNGYDDSLTIDRIYEDKDYCPENCRWVTKEVNSKYKSRTSMIYVNGEVHSGKDWARILGIGLNTINNYVRKYGLDNTILFIEKYLSNPGLKLCPKQSYYDLYMN